ncbi:hypothetical protein SMW94_003855 [Vibrio parahaemolyticus]|nr:hypothetical protein [Vibrio parahaemolyticus]
MKTFNMAVKFISETGTRMPLIPIVKVLDCISEYISEVERDNIEFIRASLPDVPRDVIDNLEDIKTEISKGRLQSLFVEDVVKGSVEFLIVKSMDYILSAVVGALMSKVVDKTLVKINNSKRVKSAEDYGRDIEVKVDTILMQLDEDAYVDVKQTESERDINIRVWIHFRTDYSQDKSDPQVPPDIDQETGINNPVCSDIYRNDDSFAEKLAKS